MSALDPRTILDARLARGEISLAQHKELVAAIAPQLPRSLGVSRIKKYFRPSLYFLGLFGLSTLHLWLCEPHTFRILDSSGKIGAVLGTSVPMSLVGGIFYKVIKWPTARKWCWEILSVGNLIGFTLMQLGCAR